MVYVIGLPGVDVAEPSVFVTLRSTVFSGTIGEITSVSVETLLAALISAVPVGAVIAAVFVTAPVAPAFTVTVSVNAALAPTASGVVFVALTTPAVGPVTVHPAGGVKDTNAVLGRSMSVSVAPVIGVVPRLVTVIV